MKGNFGLRPQLLDTLKKYDNKAAIMLRLPYRQRSWGRYDGEYGEASSREELFPEVCRRNGCTGRNI
ncbi:MAG: hypothetical protein ACLTD2_00855 [Ruminococcus sp.]